MITTRKILLSVLVGITIIFFIVRSPGSRVAEDFESAATDAAVDQSADVSGDDGPASTVRTSNVEHSETSTQQPSDVAVSAASDAVSVENTNGPVGVDSTAQSAGDSVRAQDSSAPTLNERVFFVIDEAQRRQQAGDWEASLLELNALYADFDSLNPFEQSTLLNFYTNTLIRLEMWQESISAFSLMLTVEDLRPDLNARALMALGQLHDRVNEVSEATAYYQEWLAFTRGMPGLDEQTARVQQRLNSLQGP